MQKAGYVLYNILDDLVIHSVSVMKELRCSAWISSSWREKKKKASWVYENKPDLKTTESGL